MNNSPLKPALIIWGGIDVGSKSFDACFCQRSQEPTAAASLRNLPAAHYPRTRQGAAQFAQQLPAGCMRVAMESTGRYSLELAWWLKELLPGLEISIVNPRRIADYARSLGLRNKTDRLDAAVIASYGAERQPAAWSPWDDCWQSLQSLSRTRQSLAESKTRHGNQLADLMRAQLPAPVRGQLMDGLGAVIQSLQEQIKAINKAMEALLAHHLELAAQAQLLDTIPGVGPVVAMGLLGELGDLRRFGARKALETFAGMNVGVKQSGTCLNQTRGLSKEGSRRVRRLLFLAAMAATKGDNSFATFYKRLVARGKKKKVALGAVMRKLLNVMRQVTITAKQYDNAKVSMS